GSVGFMFDQLGFIEYPAETASADVMFEASLEAGASDVESSDDGHEIYCAVEDLGIVRDALEEQFGTPSDARLDWKPQTTTELDEDKASTLLKLLDVLEDNDDVQRVASNFEVSDEVMERLSA
nr:YebC/PmpR family DNA-binding transcriptional regulator [Alphaproteobacteria bacterium]